MTDRHIRSIRGTAPTGARTTGGSAARARVRTGVRIHNGMPAGDLGEHGWERPWSGPNGGQCLEVKRLGDGRVAVRQSSDPTGPALIYTSEAISDFVRGVKQGAADHLVAR
jgi:Domain of unknown function (DUF397)